MTEGARYTVLVLLLAGLVMAAQAFDEYRPLLENLAGVVVSALCYVLGWSRGKRGKEW